VGFSALRAEDNNPLGSNITRELITCKMKISK
jgi:hypothetical protein